VTVQTPAIRSGILKAFDSGTYLATVQFFSSLQTFVSAIPVSRDIASGDMTAGRRVAVAFFDPANQADAVLFAVWT
jgi:hypothetical protein